MKKEKEVVVTFQKSIIVHMPEGSTEEQAISRAVDVHNEEIELGDMFVYGEQVVKVESEDYSSNQNSFLDELDHNVRISLIKSYDYYIQDANNEGLFDEGWRPVCIEEYYHNEFQDIESSAFSVAFPEEEYKEESLNDYLVVVNSEFVRDTQIADSPESDAGDEEGWHDTTGEHVLGIFRGTNESEVIEQAAVISHMSGEMLIAYELKNNRKGGR
ncbi:hypothetical protein J2S74_002929 [Evansella vedderi]|uniref:Uncharacterized protein n=1 Tax=Evansella vedderi TaxID=38282 RepID=A0ABT9ZWE5_9BACI|nr:hypothetical protein [Evansella vedderi]MDQ0255547.1 hypothetical protein [Evansella vedderi]